MKSSWFRSARFKRGKQKGGNAGLGFSGQDRPGLGSSAASTSSSASASTSSGYEQNEYLMSTTSEKVGWMILTIYFLNLIITNDIMFTILFSKLKINYSYWQNFTTTALIPCGATLKKSSLFGTACFGTACFGTACFGTACFSTA